MQAAPLPASRRSPPRSTPVTLPLPPRVPCAHLLHWLAGSSLNPLDREPPQHRGLSCRLTATPLAPRTAPAVTGPGRSLDDSISGGLALSVSGAPATLLSGATRGWQLQLEVGTPPLRRPCIINCAQSLLQRRQQLQCLHGYCLTPVSTDSPPAPQSLLVPLCFIGNSLAKFGLSNKENSGRQESPRAKLYTTPTCGCLQLSYRESS